MRSLHSTVALALVALLGPATLRGQAQAPPAPAASQLMVFLRGVPAGNEDVTVSRTAEGTTIAGSARLGSPISVTVRKAEIRYGADGQALSCNVEGSIRDRLLVVVATVTGTTAAWSVTEGTSSRQKTDTIDAGAVLLTPVFFGSYEALAWRLRSMKAGDTLQVLAPGQGPMSAKVLGSSEERIQTLAGLVNARRSMIAIDESKGPLEMEVWGDAAGRLVRLSVPSQGIEVMRSDVATVAARQVQVSRPNDESVRVPANGFTIAATVSKPEAPALAPKAKPPRLPAVVLVGGTGETDRDETVGGVPVLGQLSSGLADAGFLVVRYDRRGIGQSGGRAETVTLPDLAEDVRAVVKYARRRKDVDSDRVAVLGYGEGGMVTLLAAAGHDDIEAVVLVAAPGVAGTEMVLEQQRRALARLNLTDADRQARIDLQKRIQQAVLTHTGWEGIPADLRNRAETPLFESRLAFDPVKTVPRTRQPMLIVHGSLDKQMDPSNAEQLASLARARKRPAGAAVKVAMLPGLNHLLVPATTGEVDEYASLPDKTVARAAIDAIAGWLRDTMPPKKR
jgi:pimeloyl-ACP methyl ester carboxylesterase